MSKKISCVIINYDNYEVTINCVKSLIEHEPTCNIIVVDNCSPNDSYNILLEKFEKQIIIIKSSTNLGYANACNLGIYYARNKLGSEYVVILNSDIIVDSDNVFKNAIDISDDSAAFISLSMLNKDGSFQNPYCCFNGGVFYNYFCSWLYIIKNELRLLNRRSKLSVKESKSFEFYKNNYQQIINSAAGILTPLFFSKYNYLFTDTFFYTEEFCLFAYLKKAKLKSDYLNCGNIYHLENQSSISNSKAKSKIKILKKAYRKDFGLIMRSYKSIKNKYDLVDFSKYIDKVNLN